MVIVLMTNSVFTKHLAITVRSLFLIFLCINRFLVLAKTYGLPFPPPIIECIEALESIHSLKGNCSICYQLLAAKGTMQQKRLYFDKIVRFSCSNHNVVPGVQPSSSLIERYLVLLYENVQPRLFFYIKGRYGVYLPLM